MKMLVRILFPNNFYTAEITRVFPKIDDSVNFGNKGLNKEEQNKFRKKLPPVGIEPGALLTELT